MDACEQPQAFFRLASYHRRDDAARLRRTFSMHGKSRIERSGIFHEILPVKPVGGGRQTKFQAIYGSTNVLNESKTIDFC